MTPRTKTLVRNIVMLPIIIVIRVPLALIYLLADEYVRFIEDYGHHIPMWQLIPPTEKQAQAIAAMKQRRKQEFIDAIKGVKNDHPH